MDQQLTIYILGAGFSRAFVKTAPLAENFLAGFNLADTPDVAILKQFAKRCGFPSLESANIELLLTLAAMPKPWMSPSSSLHCRQVAESLRVLVGNVLSDRFPCTAEEATWAEERGDPPFSWIWFSTSHTDALNRFASALLHDMDSHVITFNYDLLLDNILATWHEINSPDGISSEPLPPRRFENEISYGLSTRMPHCPSAQLLRLIKLHGSLNWRIPRRSHSSSVLSNEIMCERPDRKYSETPNSSFQLDPAPFIIPPLLDKGPLLEHPAIASLWANAVDLLRRANKLVFIGYSLPVTDFAAEFLFRYEANPKEVEVVNLASDKKAEQLIRDRFNSLFAASSDVTYHFAGAVDYCQKIKLASWQDHPSCAAPSFIYPE